MILGALYMENLDLNLFSPIRFVTTEIKNKKKIVEKHNLSNLKIILIQTNVLVRKENQVQAERIHRNLSNWQIDCWE